MQPPLLTNSAFSGKFSAGLFELASAVDLQGTNGKGMPCCKVSRNWEPVRAL
jgi:hypothetical protein